MCKFRFKLGNHASICNWKVCLNIRLTPWKGSLEMPQEKSVSTSLRIESLRWYPSLNISYPLLICVMKLTKVIEILKFSEGTLVKLKLRCRRQTLIPQGLVLKPNNYKRIILQCSLSQLHLTNAIKQLCVSVTWISMITRTQQESSSQRYWHEVRQNTDWNVRVRCSLPINNNG